MTEPNVVPTRMSFAPDRMFVNAGGNVLASDDDGASWHQLYGLQSNGKPTAQVCPVKFELVGTQLFLGGECPLRLIREVIFRVPRLPFRHLLEQKAFEPIDAIAGRKVSWLRLTHAGAAAPDALTTRPSGLSLSPMSFLELVERTLRRAQRP